VFVHDLLTILRQRFWLVAWGWGFTAAAALQNLGAQAQVVVAELVPAVVAWNRGPLAHLAGHPLTDSRITIQESDVALILKAEQQTFHAVMLDVDNGPDGLTRSDNDWLYGRGRTQGNLYCPEACWGSCCLVSQSRPCLFKAAASGRILG